MYIVIEFSLCPHICLTLVITKDGFHTSAGVYLEMMHRVIDWAAFVVALDRGDDGYLDSGTHDIDADHGEYLFESLFFPYTACGEIEKSDLKANMTIVV